ncbi:hypothetical protein BV22DRAFT_1013313, partial [Leucogyrophana mollusca]
QLRKGADGARGDDGASLKGAVISWVTELYHPVEPPLRPGIKSDRGLEHDVTGHLLCPVDYNWDDAEVRGKIRERDPSFLVTADSFPRFLYDTGHEYNPRHIEEGLFKSTLLLKTFLLIFTSPTSAQEVTAANQPPQPQQPGRRSDRVSTRSHVASLIGMRSVTPRAIAYAAVQLRFALSSVSSWRTVDGDFDYSEFYNLIVDYFEMPGGLNAAARVRRLLLWWDRWV